MLALMLLSIAAHAAANLICPVWRSAPESANSLAVLGYLSQTAVVVWMVAKPLRRWWRRLPEIQWCDRDGSNPRKW